MLSSMLWVAAWLHAPPLGRQWSILAQQPYRRNLAITLVDTHLDQHAQLRVAFDTFDADGNGEISMAELDDAMTSFGYILLEDELASIMGEHNSKEPTIDFDKFCRLAEEHPQDNYAEAMLRSAIRKTFSEVLPPSAADAPSTAADAKSTAAAKKGDEGFAVFFDLFQEVSTAFDHFDENSDGTITPTEMGEVLRSLGHAPSDEDLAAMVAAYDENENGTIDFDEFCLLVTDQVRPKGVSSAVVEMVSDAARQAVSGIRKNNLVGT